MSRSPVDVTEEHRSSRPPAAPVVNEEQSIQAQKVEAIATLVGAVAHDLNNILLVVLNSATFARDRLDAADPSRGDLDRILQVAECATGLTKQLVALANRPRAAPRILDLNSHVGETAAMLRCLVGNGTELSVAPAESLWLTRIDPGHLDQILLNLAINARDAMPDGGRLTIATRNVVLDEAGAREHGGVGAGEYVMLSVRDTGVGMSAEVKEHAFEPFVTTKAPGPSTGLGLATCHRIARRLGGSILANSQLGEGTAIDVLLPRAVGVAVIPVATTRPAKESCASR